MINQSVNQSRFISGTSLRSGLPYADRTWVLDWRKSSFYKYSWPGREKKDYRTIPFHKFIKNISKQWGNLIRKIVCD